MKISEFAQVLSQAPVFDAVFRVVEDLLPTESHIGVPRGQELRFIDGAHNSGLFTEAGHKLALKPSELRVLEFVGYRQRAGVDLSTERGLRQLVGGQHLPPPGDPVKARLRAERRAARARQAGDAVHDSGGANSTTSSFGASSTLSGMAAAVLVDEGGVRAGGHGLASPQAGR